MALATVTSALWSKLSVVPAARLTVLVPKEANASVPSPTFKVPPETVVSPV